MIQEFDIRSLTLVAIDGYDALLVAEAAAAANSGLKAVYMSHLYTSLTCPE